MDHNRWVALWVVLAAMLVGLVLLMCTRGQAWGVVYEPDGKLVRVLDCNASKVSNYCGLQLEDRSITYANINDFPGGKLEVGDRLGRMYFVFDRGEEMWKCRNQRCRAYSYCPVWMGCYDGQAKSRLFKQRLK